MTSRIRREKLDREPSLGSIAHASPDTGRGFAASKGVRLPYAMSTGATVKIARPRDWSGSCIAETFCDGERQVGYLWCERHVTRAQRLGAAVPEAS